MKIMTCSWILMCSQSCSVWIKFSLLVRQTFLQAVILYHLVSSFIIGVACDSLWSCCGIEQLKTNSSLANQYFVYNIHLQTSLVPVVRTAAMYLIPQLSAVLSRMYPVQPMFYVFLGTTGNILWKTATHKFLHSMLKEFFKKSMFAVLRYNSVQKCILKFIQR